MKKLSALCLLLIVLIQCSMKLAIVVSYEINKEYITATFCENKSKPQLHCDGKCYLAKKIQAEEQQEQPLSSILKKLGEINLFFSSSSVDYTPIGYNKMLSHQSAYLLQTYASPLSDILQPPQ